MATKGEYVRTAYGVYIESLPTIGDNGVSASTKEPYGDVEYADPGFREGIKRYPLSSEEKIRAAWNYIHQKRNADKYTPKQLAHIKHKIISAWKKRIDPSGPPSAKEE